MLAIPQNPTDREVWSQAVLQLLGAIAGGGISPGEPTVKIDQAGTNNGVQLVGGTQRTWTSTSNGTSPGSGTVAAGSKAVMFTLSSDYEGNINGIARLQSETPTIQVSPPYPKDTNPAIAWTVTAGTLKIDVLT